MFKVISLLAAAAAAAIAQTPPIQPDCPIRVFTFTGPIASASYNNTNQGCTVWVAGYQSLGFSGISLHFQSSNDGVTYGDFGGDIANGVNPQVVSPGAGVTRFSDTEMTGTAGFFAPFVRLNLASATGSGTVIAWYYGYKAGSAGQAGGGGSGGGGSGCAGTVGTPCVTGAENSSLTAVTDFTCDHTAPFNVMASSGDFQIVAATSGKAIHVCNVSFSSNTAVNFELDYGTGSNCGTGTTALTGDYINVLSFALDWPPRAAPVTPVSQALCGNFSGTVTSGGTLQYALF